MAWPLRHPEDPPNRSPQSRTGFPGRRDRQSASSPGNTPSAHARQIRASQQTARAKVPARTVPQDRLCHPDHYRSPASTPLPEPAPRPDEANLKFGKPPAPSSRTEHSCRPIDQSPLDLGESRHLWSGPAKPTRAQWRCRCRTDDATTNATQRAVRRPRHPATTSANSLASTLYQA